MRASLVALIDDRSCHFYFSDEVMGKSNTQIDKIGDSLRRGQIDERVLTDLSDYQAEFDPAYRYVERILTKKMYLEITGRPAKSTISIVEKLRRIRTRLSQMQDLAGCRVIVHSLDEQTDVVEQACQWFSNVQVDDKRSNPTHGYRAVHLIVQHEGKLVEVQVRTRIQHFWATISEKLSDSYGQDIKYGSGDSEVLSLLSELSESARRFDEAAARFAKLKAEEIMARSGRDYKLVKAMEKRLEPIEARVREIMYGTRSVLIKIEKLEAKHVLLD